jgi:hypothetical protein
MMPENTERIYLTGKATKEQKELSNSSISSKDRSSLIREKRFDF